MIHAIQAVRAFYLKRDTLLRILLTLLIPGLLWFFASVSHRKNQVDSSTVHLVLPKDPSNDNPISFADTPPIPGPGVWQTTPSGTKYLDLAVGAGPSPQVGQQVAFIYAVRLENGKVIASTRFDIKNRNLELLTGVYGYTPFPSGWTEAVSTMKVGGWRRFILSPESAYGKETFGGLIPPNSTLVIDAQLLYLDPTILPKDSYQ